MVDSTGGTYGEVELVELQVWEQEDDRAQEEAEEWRNFLFNMGQNVIVLGVGIWIGSLKDDPLHAPPTPPIAAMGKPKIALQPKIANTKVSPAAQG